MIGIVKKMSDSEKTPLLLNKGQYEEPMQSSTSPIPGPSNVESNSEAKGFSVSFRESGIIVQPFCSNPCLSKEMATRRVTIPKLKGKQKLNNGDSEKMPLFVQENKSKYRSIDDPGPSSAGGSRTVYCIHGDKMGVAKCCDCWLIDMEPEITEEGATGIEPIDATTVANEDHCHDGSSSNSVDKTARRKLIIASVLCLVFMIIEIVGGILAGSLAIATDAAHLLTDFASFLISLFSLWVASRPATRSMSFGWHRAEVIGATISVLLIWVVTGILVYAAILRVYSMDFEIDATIMLISSGIGVFVNIIMGCSLHQGHGHGHSHSHEEESNSGRTNINVQAAFIHVVGDFVQSVGVFIAALIIYLRPDWKIADPICTFIFSILVLVTTIQILRDTMNVLMEGTPKAVNFSIVEETLLAVDGIIAVHNLRIWGLTTDKTALSAHLVVSPTNMNEQQILKTASAKLRAKYNIFEMTLQVEQFQQNMEDCQKCLPPSK